MTLRVRRLIEDDDLVTPSPFASNRNEEIPPLSIPPEAISQGQIDLSWALRTLQITAEEKQSLLREVSDSLSGLRSLATQFCNYEWDEAQRKGQKPEAWGAKRLIEFIREIVPQKMGMAAIASDPQVSQKFTEAMNEISRLNAKNENLAQQYSDARRLSARLTQDNEKLQQQLARAKREGGGRESGRSSQRNDIPVDNRAAQSSATGQQVSTPAESVVNVSDELVRFLAETGLSRSKEIKEKFVDYFYRKFKRNRGSNQVARDSEKLVSGGFLVQYEIRIERHGQQKGYMYELSDSGVLRAKALGIGVVESEVKKGKRAHTTLEHFYQILDVGDVLKNAGYRVSLYESSISFQDGTHYVPDIKAIAPDERVIYVEVERSPRGADALEQKYVRAAVLCGGDLFIGVINKGKARKVGEYALEIKARRGNAVKHVFILNVGDPQSATLWKEIEQLNDLSVAEGSALDVEDDGQGGEN